jgi:NADPH-dependent 2,4-dienoyl-CoA reductase/sulfur reductase-like enzyme
VAAATDEVLDQFLSWLIGQVDRAGVDLALATTVDAPLVAALGVSDVVVATGGRWLIPSVAGSGSPRVRTVAEVAHWLTGADGASNDRSSGQLPDGPVVVLGGGKVGMSVARWCATDTDRSPRPVTVLEAGDVFAPQIGPPGRFRLVHEIEQLGVDLVAGAELQRAATGWPIGWLQ